MKDPYKILGVDRNADEADIKKAYRKLAKQYHPDKSTGNEDKFKEIADAYEAITDPKRRGNIGGNPFGFTDEFFEDFIKSGSGGGFSSMFNKRYGPNNNKGGDVTTQIHILLEDAYYGCKRSIRIGTKTVNVEIKPGVKPGQRMRLKGLGQKGMTEEQNGDLILTILILDNPNFYLDQKGLHTIKHISLYDALLGGKAEVNVFGKTITYTIPKCVKNGTMLRIKGKGFPNYNNPDVLGDLIVNILVNLPESLTEKQEELIKKMKDLENGI